jgi:hypothetical protein
MLQLLLLLLPLPTSLVRMLPRRTFETARPLSG